MILQYLHEKIENSAIISLDSLFALPDFRIQEKILYMLIRIRSLTTKNFIVQTRKSDEKVFKYGLSGNMSDFYREEISERKKFNYPPFSNLIKITLEGKKDDIIKEMENVQNILDPYEVEVFPAFTQTVRGNQVLHGLIRLPHGKWPDKNLIEKIRSLSPAVMVKVDPETLL
jgi:primosomal protein N'